jgi:hypothetical protein
MNATLAKLQAKHPDKIAGWYKDSDGYWINLRKGWQWEECHAVHEWNVRDALASFRDVKPCDCGNCRAVQ